MNNRLLFPVFALLMVFALFSQTADVSAQSGYSRLGTTVLVGTNGVVSQPSSFWLNNVIGVGDISVDLDPLGRLRLFLQVDTNTALSVHWNALLDTPTPVSDIASGARVPLMRSSTFEAWTDAGGTFTNEGMIATSPLLTNGVAAVTYDASGQIPVIVQMSSNGSVWSDLAATNTTMMVRLVATNTVPALGDATVTVSNIVATSWTHPALFAVRNDTAGQVVLVDDPAEARSAVNLATMQAAIAAGAAAVNPAQWAAYPASETVKADRIVLGGVWGVQASTNGSLEISGGGVPFVTFAYGDGTETGLNIATMTLDGLVATIDISTNGVAGKPLAQWSASLTVQDWRTLEPTSETYPELETNGFYRIVATLPADSGFVRAVYDAGEASASVRAHVLPAAGGTYDLGSAAAPWRAAYLDSLIVVGTNAPWAQPPTNKTHAVFVSTVGSDSNSGLTLMEPKLTINAAIVAATNLAASGVRVWVIDGGTYTEDITLPTAITIDAKGATLVGTASITGGSELYLDRHFPSDSNQSMLTCEGAGTGPAIYSAHISDGRGVGGAFTGTRNVRNVGGGGRNLFAKVGIMYVSAGGTGVGDVSIGDAGHIHMEIPDLYLAGNNAIGILAAAQGTGYGTIIGWSDHILEISGNPTNTTGISITDAQASVKLVTAEIVADTAYNITTGSLYLTSNRISGTRTGTPLYLASDQGIRLQGDVLAGTASLTNAAALAAGALQLDQTTPQAVTGGKPTFSSGIRIMGNVVDDNGVTFLNPITHDIYDLNNFPSISPHDHQLKRGEEGIVTFDWANLKFPTLSTNGFLKTSNNDGTLTVDTNTYLTTSGSGASLTGITASQVGAVSTNHTGDVSISGSITAGSYSATITPTPLSFVTNLTISAADGMEQALTNWTGNLTLTWPAGSADTLTRIYLTLPPRGTNTLTMTAGPTYNFITPLNSTNNASTNAISGLWYVSPRGTTNASVTTATEVVP